MIQFKEKAAKAGTEATTVGLFTYPVLQAADILLYDTDQVPVGEDQRQHLELTRDLAQRFNHRFGKTMVVPGPYILPGVAKIADLQDPAIKMSKSASSPQGIIDVLEDPESISRKIIRAVTDAGDQVVADEQAKPGITNLLRIYSGLTGQGVPELEQRYAGSGYGAFKRDLAEVVVAALAPIRERTEKLLADQAELDAILAHGARRAHEIAVTTMSLIRERVGFLPLAR
jgi:tryptophanyl-tRNA synthetase